MKRPLEKGLDTLKEKLILMAGIAEEAIRVTVQGLKSRDTTCIDKIYALEDQVNQYHKEVDSLCLQFLATQQPMAVDLRAVLAIIKINSDLERMVDQTVNLIRNMEYFFKSPEQHGMTELLEMSEAVRFMVRESIDSFVRGDELLAVNVIKCDDKVDAYKDRLFYETAQRMRKNSSEVERGLALILIARNLERIADHATNVAEDVIFSVSGKDIRHKAKTSKKEKHP